MGILKNFFNTSSKKTKSLSEQYIRCPECSTLYALFSHINLDNHVGDVLCGTCESTFSPLTNRSQPKTKVTLPKKIEAHFPKLVRVPPVKPVPVIETQPIIEDFSAEQITTSDETITETHLEAEPTSQSNFEFEPTATETFFEAEPTSQSNFEVEPTATETFFEAEPISQSNFEVEPTATETFFEAEPISQSNFEVEPTISLNTVESEPIIETVSHTIVETEPLSQTIDSTDTHFTPDSIISNQDSTAIMEIRKEPLTSMEILAIAPGDAIASAPIYTKTQKVKSERHIWNYLLGASIVLLLVLLSSLIFWLNRDTLAQYTLTRPWLESLCDNLGCTLPPYRDPSLLLIQQHQLTPDPADPNKLEFHALIENGGAYAQPLGTLEIKINDLQGNLVKTLTFSPEEYAPEEAKSLLEPGQTLYIRLEFIQPTLDLFSYDIKFI